MRKPIAATILALGLAATTNLAAAGKVDQHSRAADARLVQVKPGERRFFYRMGETPGCPALTQKCRRSGYVLPGDILLAWQSGGGFTAVEFVTAKGQHSYGAIETEALEPVAAQATPPLSAWIGGWSRDSEANIVIKAIGRTGRLRVSGFAVWGMKDPVRVRNGGIHDGELEGIFVPSGAWGGVLEDGTERLDWQRAFPFNSDDGYDCQAQFRLLGPYLLVTDDGDHCGGVNVTFSGVYRKG